MLEHDLLLCARLRVFLHDEIARQYVLTVTQRMHEDGLIPACYQLFVLLLPRGWGAVEEIAFGGRRCRGTGVDEMAIVSVASRAP